MSISQLTLSYASLFSDVKLPPRAAFAAQIIGTLFGSILNLGWFFYFISSLYLVEMILKCSTVIMNSIIDNQWEILLSIQGTNIWSGQQPQQYNSQAIAWGGLRWVFYQSSFEFVDDHLRSHELFAIGKRYQFVAWAYLIGLMVPVPFWIMYKLWPKLRTDYLYTPMLWCVDDLSWLITILIHQH